ncbi:MAG: nucleotidyl transferase AbiEii/AbiGii toxin family protein [Clostridiales bacterium]|nr:nucleotidyl transferase AbiEii/AbiGii toxin family protein [Clostridiales bacterium]
MKNAMQLKAYIKNMAKEKHISAQIVLQNYMLERLLERISVSEYHDNFILKGGFLLAAMVGLDTRATMDMEFDYAKDIRFEDTYEAVLDLMNEVVRDTVFIPKNQKREIREKAEEKV